MLQELAGFSFEEKAYMMALAIIDTKVKELSAADRDDLFEVIREFMTTEDEEAKESAARAIAEILEPCKGTVRKMPDVGKPTQWIEFISKRIRDLRAAAGLTQEQLAERSGLTQSHICRLERGDHSPNGLTLEKIAKGLGVPTSRLAPSAEE